MPSPLESRTINVAGNKVHVTNAPLKRYIIVYHDSSDVIEASNMCTNEHGVVFEESIIRGSDGVRIGIGRTFIEHSQLVGVTLVEQEFGGVYIDNSTKLGLFTVINDDESISV